MILPTGFSKCSKIQNFLNVLFLSIWILTNAKHVKNCDNPRKVFDIENGGQTYGIISNYENDSFNCEWLIVASDMTNMNKPKYINLKIVSINLSCHSDLLYIFDGNSFEDKLISTLSGNSVYSEPLIASSGYLLILLYSDLNANFPGFVAEYSITDCPLNCSSHGACFHNECLCDQFYGGNACQVELCPNNCSYSGQCISTPSADLHSEYYCSCMPEYFGQSCDAVKSDYNIREDLFGWKLLFKNEEIFYGRASHSSVYDSHSDTIYTYGGRNHEKIFGDLLAFHIPSNQWHNLSNCDTNTSTLLAPSPLWGHSLNIHEHFLILFGGYLSNGTISNELWFYDILINKWTLEATESKLIILGLAFHTATRIDSKWLYIHGGRLQNRTISSNLYRINLLDQSKQWETIVPMYQNVYLSHLMGHTSTYYHPLNSIIFFGGISLSNGRISRLNNIIQLYHIGTNVWSLIEFPEDHSDIPSERAFHSMLIIGQYILIFGGYTHSTINNSQTAQCFDDRLYVYCLTCHKWINFDIFISTHGFRWSYKSAPTSLFSHTLVGRKNAIFLLGGYSGSVRNDILMHHLPASFWNLSQSKLCSQIDDNAICDNFPFCTWYKSSHLGEYSQTSTKGQCQYLVDYSNITKCAGICSRLTSCYSCLTYGTSDLGSFSLPCAWNAVELKCVNSHKEDLKDHILTSLSECIQNNILAGVALLKYYYPQNMSYPDELAFLHKTYDETSFRNTLSDQIKFNDAVNVRRVLPSIKYSKPNNSALINVARILGFIHPLGVQSFEENSIRLYLSSASPQARFLLNGSDEQLRKEISNKSANNSYVNIDNISIDEQNSFLIDYIVQFPIKITSEKLQYEKIGISWQTNEADYQVAPLFETKPYRDPNKCNQFSTCNYCLSNTACGWCRSRNNCVSRINATQCDPEEREMLIVDASACSGCTQHILCDQCVTSQECEWIVEESICVRKGRFSISIRNVSSCPTECHNRFTCASCLDHTNYCMWCESNQRCILSSSYYLPETFEFCRQFDLNNYENNLLLNDLRLNNSFIQCSPCLQHTSCSICIKNLNCDWCYSDRNPHLGFCTLNTSSENICNFSLQSETHLFFRPLNQTFVPARRRCPPVDECKLGLHNCHINGICIDTDEYFKCVCKHGYTGNGVTCTRTCNQTCLHGFCLEFPDFKCICDLGWTGNSCDIDCGCHQHSTCTKKIGTCDYCEFNTRGQHCHLCLPGYYGNATDAFGCSSCSCNEHGDQIRGFCDQITGSCYCTNNTEGLHCERCATGFYGDPKNGKPCFMECQHRALISQPDFGYFGSYIKDIHFGKHNYLLSKNLYYSNTNINCLWIITSYSSPKMFSSFVEYFQNISMPNKNVSPRKISLKIFKSIKVNCSLGRVIIYDGLPHFVSASNISESKVLANLCGNKISTDIQLAALSGFATVLYLNENLHQGFNASYKLSDDNINLKSLPYTHSSDTNVSHTSKVQSGMLKNKVSSVNAEEISFGPKITHSLHYLEDMLVFVGGHLDSAYLNISMYNLTTHRWHRAFHLDSKTPINRHLHSSTLINKTIFIYGGLNHASNKVLQDFWNLTFSYSNNEFWLEWNLIKPLNSDKVPPLLGHSLTSINSSLLLIGGYSPDYGFLDKQYLYIPSTNEWKWLNTKGVSPVGIFAHSAVYHSVSRSIYVFGGIDFKESQKTSSSNTLYILNVANYVWHRILPSSSNQRHFPLPIYLHSAVTTRNYMLVIDSGSDKQIPSAFAYDYRCNQWLSFSAHLRTLANITLNSISQFLSIATNQNHLYIYQSPTPFWVNSTFHNSIIEIELPEDLCSFFSQNQKECLAVVGCSFCLLKANGTLCFNSDSIETHENCLAQHTNLDNEVVVDHQCSSVQAVMECSHYVTCADCTTRNYYSDNQDDGCQWCSDCRNKEGRCIKLNDTCDYFEFNYTLSDQVLCPNISVEETSMCPLQKCFATDCHKCLTYSTLNKHRHDSEVHNDCTWTRQVYKFIRLGHTMDMNPIFDWACIDSSIIENNMHLPNVETIPPLSCPARCHKHKTCSLCLEEAHGDESGSHECVWSELTHECMSPTYATLRCMHGLCGGFLHRRLHSQCPLECETYKKASDCLTVLHCGWCAINGLSVDGIGVCLKGGLFGPLNKQCSNTSKIVLDALQIKSFYNYSSEFGTEWSYLFLPKENECLNGHHTCDPKSQICVDLDDGFMCRCKPGYKMIEGICKPICHQGCVFGVCIAPDVCSCNFGYIGQDCSIECQCNGHSTCFSVEKADICTECYNNTQGQFCDQCKPLYVGNPKNFGSCQSCFEYCNNHSDLCFHSDIINNSLIEDHFNESFWYEISKDLNHGTEENAVCINCKNNTEGERCDRCKLGFFKISDDIRDGCRQCMCNDHGFICNPFNGENCNCHNNTENDRQCNYLNSKEYSNYINKTYFYKSAQIMTTYSLPCWMLQCSKCKDYFYGIPTNGHQCYRHMYIDKEYCFDPITQEDCLLNPRPLLHARTVYFGIQPRYMNVDIKIVVYVFNGDVDLYLTSKDDMFVVKVNKSTGFHHTFMDNKYVNLYSNVSLIPAWNEYSDINEDSINYLNRSELDDVSLNSETIPLKSPTRLSFQKIRNEVVYFYTVKSLNEVVVFRNIRNRLEISIPYKVHDLRTTRFYIMLRGNNLKNTGNYGHIIFRQDQCRIDLFVFFSVFFSCFFLFLCLLVLLWKLKQILDHRRARHLHEIELENMASRPFAKVFILMDESQVWNPYDGVHKKNLSSQSVHSTPAKKMSLFRQLTIGFKDTPKIYPESPQPLRIANNSPSSPNIKPVSMEYTSDGLAAVMTTFVQLPGDILAPHRLTAASALVSLKLSPQLVLHVN